nr:MAG TPA: hypothetical protein [Bacteriophage sp.]
MFTGEDFADYSSSQIGLIGRMIMNKEVLEKANNLILDIELLSIILHERETDPGYVIVNA